MGSSYRVRPSRTGLSTAWPGDDTFYINGGGLPITLNGGDGNDRFKLAADGSVEGRMDGGAGSDILDYGLFHSPATVNLQDPAATADRGFTAVEGFVGSNLLSIPWSGPTNQCLGDERQQFRHGQRRPVRLV